MGGASGGGGQAAGGFDANGRYQEGVMRPGGTRGHRHGGALGGQAAPAAPEEAGGFAGVMTHLRRTREAEAQGGAQGSSNMTIDPEWASENPQDAQAQLIDNQREDFNARYRPLEDAAIAEFMKSPEQAAQRAGGIAGEGFQNVGGMTQRALSRQGASMTADQMRASGDSTGLAQARSVGTAENTMRRHLNDRNMDGLGTMVGVGRGLQGSVNSGMDSAAGMQNARNQAGSQARAAHKQNMISTGVAVAGLAIMA